MGNISDLKHAANRMAITATRVLFVDIIVILLSLLLALFNLLVFHKGFNSNISFYPPFNSLWTFITLLCWITASLAVVVLLINGQIESIVKYFKID
jgi:hypothetical protein